MGMGIAGLLRGAGAGEGLQTLLKQRLMERQMALAEQAQRENSDYRNRALEAGTQATAQNRQFQQMLQTAALQDKQQAGVEKFAAGDVGATAVGASITPERANLWEQGGQGGVIRNAVQGTVSDADVGGERPAQQLFRGYTPVEAERFNAREAASEDRIANREDQQAFQAEQRKEGAKDRAAMASAVGSKGALTPEGLQVAANWMIGRGEVPPLGMGSQGRIAAFNEVGRRDPNFDPALAGADYKANSGSILQLQRRYGAAHAFSTQAAQSLENVRKASANVPRTGAPLVNRYMLWFNKNLQGQAPLSTFEVYAYNAARDYARVTSGAPESGSPNTDAANEAADALLNASLNPDQVNAVLDAMQQDMFNTTDSIQAELEAAKNRIGRKSGASIQAPGQPRESPQASGKSVTMAQIQAIAKKNGTTVEQETARAQAEGYVVR